MLYQKLLTGTRPYHLSMSRTHHGFEEHRHPDVEFSYCLSGTYDLIIDRQLYHLKPGDLAVIGCMVSHEVPRKPQEALTLTMEVGPILLKEHFQMLAEGQFAPVYSLREDSPLRPLLEETAALYQQQDAYAELMLTGNLYKISACIGRECSMPVSEEEEGEQAAAKIKEKPRRPILEIEKALELIYSHYAQNITVEDAAAAAGYSKSNFCTVFKNVVGDSFHHVLNRHRVENACYFLRQTETSVSDIAVMVGFADSKSFCRVFKNFYGVTPGEYRQQESLYISRS